MEQQRVLSAAMGILSIITLCADDVVCVHILSLIVEVAFAAHGHVGLIHFSIAQAITCSVTQEDGQTCYAVPEFTATGCFYWWANGTDFVMANHGDKTDERVVKRSNSTLFTNECFKEIHYSRDCLSEGMKRVATCYTNCSRNAQPSTETGFPHMHWIIPVVVLLLLGAVLVVLSCVKNRCGSKSGEENTPV